MGQVNQPSNTLDRIKRIEAELKRLRSAIGLSSATISRGGLTLTDGAFLRMVDANEVQRLFAGGSTTIPLADGSPQPVFIMRDGSGALRFAIYDPDPVSDGYQPVVWIYDHLGHVAFTTDKNGGVAEPWISVPMYPKHFPSTFLDSTGTDSTLPASACNGNSIWEGRIGKVSHSHIQYDMVGGRVTGSGATPTYTFHVNGTQIDSFSNTGYGSYLRGPFNIASLIGQQNVAVELKVSATGTGTDRVATNMLGVWLRQTP